MGTKEENNMSTNGNGFPSERTIEVFEGRLVLAFENAKGERFLVTVTDLEGFVHAKPNDEVWCEILDENGDVEGSTSVRKQNMRNLRLHVVE